MSETKPNPWAMTLPELFALIQELEANEHALPRRLPLQPQPDATSTTTDIVLLLETLRALAWAQDKVIRRLTVLLREQT